MSSGQNLLDLLFELFQLISDWTIFLHQDSNCFDAVGDFASFSKIGLFVNTSIGDLFIFAKQYQMLCDFKRQSVSCYDDQFSDARAHIFDSLFGTRTEMLAKNLYSEAELVQHES